MVARVSRCSLTRRVRARVKTSLISSRRSCSSIRFIPFNSQTPSGMMRVQDTGRLRHLQAPLPIARVTDHFSKKAAALLAGRTGKGHRHKQPVTSKPTSWRRITKIAAMQISIGVDLRVSSHRRTSCKPRALRVYSRPRRDRYDAP